MTGETAGEVVRWAVSDGRIPGAVTNEVHFRRDCGVIRGLREEVHGQRFGS